MTLAESLADLLEIEGIIRDMGRPPVMDTGRKAAKELRVQQKQLDELKGFVLWIANNPGCTKESIQAQAERLVRDL